MPQKPNPTLPPPGTDISIIRKPTILSAPAGAVGYTRLFGGVD
jgi:hypothetical protein